MDLSYQLKEIPIPTLKQHPYRLETVLEQSFQKNASDIVFLVGQVPKLRIYRKMYSFVGKDGEELFQPITLETINGLITSCTTLQQQAYYRENLKLNFALEIPSSRLRINLARTNGQPSIVMRFIPREIRAITSLGFPIPGLATDKQPVYEDIKQLQKGLVLVTGVTGSGKTTTLAALIDLINSTYEKHIITFEDPKEYVHPQKKSVVEQRELGLDFLSFSDAIVESLRQAPDVLLLGEIRDEQTAEAAITATETGHVVYSTLHTATATETVQRFVGIFPANARDRIQNNLASTLEYVICQKLLPRTDGKGLVLAMEVMKCTDNIRNVIRKGEYEKIHSYIQTGGKEKMKLLDDHVFELFKEGLITAETAIHAVSRQRDMAIRTGFRQLD
ncbi:MAG: PilT/PilU family type 4a pilus ATPase [Nanoarchaeota archaeon]|nr:PilT/PilU family type 4a pilus ATPase [Nanoarchaeota archaeon]